MEKHSDDLHDVTEGDAVTITTTEGKHFDAECTSREKQHADPRSGEVRETNIWLFDAVEYLPAISITNGLKSSPDDPDFPLHNEIFCRQQEGSMGYVEEVTIHG